MDDLELHSFDQMINYLDITEKMGPSEQLLAFINFDNSLSTEIGLEGFDSLSLQARHEILVSHIENNIGIEALGDKLKKIGKTSSIIGSLLIFGAKAGSIAKSGSFLNKSYSTLGLGGIVLLLAGTTMILKGHIDATVVPHEKMIEFQSQFDKYIREKMLVAVKTPTDPEDPSWDEFEKYYLAENGAKYLGNLLLSVLGFGSSINIEAKISKKPAGTDFSKSGWTVDNLKKSAEWLVETTKKLVRLEEEHDKRIQTLEKHLSSKSSGDVKFPIHRMKILNNVLDKQMKDFRNAAKLLKWADSTLERVGKNFEPVKK